MLFTINGKLGAHVETTLQEHGNVDAHISQMCFDRDADPDKAVTAGEDNPPTNFPVTCTHF